MKKTLLSLCVVCLAATVTFAAQLPPQPVAGLSGSQIEGIFPQPEPSTRVLVPNKASFKAYREKCVLTVENHGVTSAELYINGKGVRIGKLEPDAVLDVDVSKLVRDGWDNALEVRNIVRPDDKAYLRIIVPYPELHYDNGKSAGFDQRKLDAIDKYINAEIAKGFPGAVLCVVKNGRIVKNTAYGYAQKYDGLELMPKPEPMTSDKMFDLASNSKMYATNLAVMQLVNEGKLDIEQPVCKYLPQFTGEGREKVLVRNLLQHNAGFVPGYDYYHNPKSKWYSMNRAHTKQLLMTTPLVYQTGTKVQYSDIDFLLLGCIVEAITGKQLDDYVAQSIYQPLGLTRTMYTPTKKGVPVAACAATERTGNSDDYLADFPGCRKYVLRGECHDGNAFYAMEGVAGHAGLFSCSEDLAVLAQMMLNQGGYGKYRLCGKVVWDRFTAVNLYADNRGLGWDKNNDWEFGPYASIYTVGHTGYTGTLTLIDPQYDLAVILLTNSLHSPFVPKEGSFVAKLPPFETARYGSIMALVYEAFMTQ